MRYAISLLLLGAALPAQNLVATVNDPKSHGTLADAKLSFDEAMQVLNGTLAMTSLSAAERAQIVGIGSYVDTIVVDAAITPVISYEKELTPVVTPLHLHMDVAITGIGMPTLDAKTFSAALPVRTNHAHIHGFKLVNGVNGIDADTTLHFHTGDYGEFGDMEISGQSNAGVRFAVASNPPGQNLPFKMHHLHVEGVPVGIDIPNQGQYANLDLEVEECHFSNCTIGVKLAATTTGGLSSVQLFRTDMLNSETCVQVRRPLASSDGQVFVRVLYGEYIATHNCFDVQGTALGDTTFHKHMALARAGANATDYALTVGPKTARFDLHASEMTFEGNVQLLCSKDTRRIWQNVCRFRNGTFMLDNDGVAPDCQWNVYESIAMQTGLGARTPFSVRDSEFHKGSVNGVASLGAITLSNCYLGQTTLAGSVTNAAPAPAPWIGRASVLPVDPPAGGFVDLQLDFQPGTAGLWVLGDALARPKTTNYPFRFYLDITTMVALPGVYQLRDKARLLIPNSAALVGHEFFAQPVAVPTASQGYVPPLFLPTGGRFVIQ